MNLPRALLPTLMVMGFLTLLPPTARTAEVWQTLPPTPTRPTPTREGHAPVNGIQLYYAVYGQGEPVLLLHGGLSNADYWGHVIPALAETHQVIVAGSRGHGRSSRDAQPYSYDLMASDVLALLDYLKISKADIVGWSDGGIIGLDIAMNHPERLNRLFAFGANTQVSGLIDGFDKTPVFAAFIERAGQEYPKLSPTPDQYDAFLEQIGAMWASQPSWTADQLARIKAPTVIADGEHDEGIKREHTEQIAREIPGAKLLILPDVSHFAIIQNPSLFSGAVLAFLAD
jgi:pimeloyl-ACP methyl ester carboxylesterase